MIRLNWFACAPLCAGLALITISGVSAERRPDATPLSPPLVVAEATAAEADDSPPHNRAVVDVRGLVCSFCAHGVERELAGLPAVDTSAYGGDGVLVEITDHRVTLALKPDSAFPLEEVRKRIRKAGYDPHRFRFWSGGELQVVDADAE